MGARPIVNDVMSVHATEREQARMRDLLELIPSRGESVLDIGARDGYLARLLADRFTRVVALDLVKPVTVHPRVACVVGDATALTYDDNAFDAVVCAEVLEHIPASALERACREIVRVARHVIIIGVPYKQDLRYGQSICRTCGKINPPWGHLNTFDEHRLEAMFDSVTLSKVSLVGRNRDRTNAVSTGLMRFAGYPHGTYSQDEPCVHCGARLLPPSRRTILQKVATRTAHSIERVQQAFLAQRANWIHARFDKSARRMDGGRP
jgi:SAM-dependent methyltransferase